MQAVGVTYQAVLDRFATIEWKSRTTRDKGLAFLQAFFRKRKMENTEPEEYTDMAYNYFTLKIGTHYRDITKPLLQSGILQSTEYYRPGYHNDEGDYIKGQCLSYRINPTLLGDDLVKINYTDKSKKQKCRDAVTMKSKQILRQLRIPDMSSRELVRFVKRSLTDQRIRKMLKVNEEIGDEVVFIKGRDVPVNVKKYLDRVRDCKSRTSDCKSQTSSPRKSLIKDGKYCYVEFLDVYIRRKRRHLTQAYCDQLLRIKHRNVYADRNETNLRLDHNVTNLKSDFIGLLSIDGQRLSQVDLKNSQFRFFVMLLEQCERQILFGDKGFDFPMAKFSVSGDRKTGEKKEKEEGEEILKKQVTLLSVKVNEFCIDKRRSTPSLSADYKLFKKLVKIGELYEYIQKIYWQETGVKLSRNEAKKLMFTIAFSSYRYCPIGKTVFKKYFPSIVNVIDGFKKSQISWGVGGQVSGKQGGNGHKIDAESGVYDIGVSDSAEYGREIESNGSDSSLQTSKIGPTQADRDRGNASFAIMLQQAESLVFIDKILAACHKKGIKALSKHDSILCRQSDKHQVTKIICRILNQLFGRFSYSLDIDGKVFQFKARKKSRIGRVVNQVVSTLFGLEYAGNSPPVRFGFQGVQDLVSASNRNTHKEWVDSKRAVAIQKEAVPYSSSGGKKLSPRVERLRRQIMG